MGLHIYHFSAPRVCKMGTSSNLPHQFKGLRSSMPSALKKKKKPHSLLSGKAPCCCGTH